MSLLISHCFPSNCRRVRVDDGLFRPQQTYGLLHHPDLHPLYLDRGPFLGLLLDQERRHAGEDRPRYAAARSRHVAAAVFHIERELFQETVCRFTPPQAHSGPTYTLIRVSLLRVSSLFYPVSFFPPFTIHPFEQQLTVFNSAQTLVELF